MRRMDDFDYRALGFTVTVDEAAEALKLTRAEMLDLIRARDISSLLVASDTPMSPATFLLHHESVRRMASEYGQQRTTVDERVRAKTQTMLRDYLAARAPVEDYDEAVELGCPLWGSAPGGRRTLNVQVDAIVDFLRADDPSLPVTSSSVTMTLERLGAVRVRGVIPWSNRGGKQRWGTLWRIPQSLLSGESAEALVRDVTAGQREPDEQYRRRPGTAPHVVGDPW